ncbi:hypothetical protein Hte_001405 [Hypoxylon texense]
MGTHARTRRFYPRIRRHKLSLPVPLLVVRLLDDVIGSAAPIVRMRTVFSKALIALEPAQGPNFKLNFETFLTWELPQYNVLLVKTGDDTHLSSPIYFKSLIESGMTLAMNRPDVGGDMEEDVVRVKIDVAMQFILDLMRREEEALPSVGKAAKLLREGHEEACKRWVERVMQHVEEFGIDNNIFTWE